MGIWKEIKKTVNSTVGTRTLKPLDVLLKDFLFSSRRFVESDKLYAEILNEFYTDGEIREHTIQLFKVNASGSFNLKFERWRSIEINVFKNGEIYKTISRHTTDDYRESNILCSCEKGDVFSLYIKEVADFTRSFLLVKNVNFYADVVDNVNLDILA